MLNFSPEKLFLVGIIALMVLGPNRLPEAARTLGRFVADLRRMSASFHEEVRDALAEPKGAITGALGEFRTPDVRRSVRDAITSALNPPAPIDHPESPSSPLGQPDASRLPVAPDDPSVN